MAPCRSQYKVEEVVAVLVVAVLMMLAGAAQEGAAECPAPANELVYPYAGSCGVKGAAQYYFSGRKVYELGVTTGIGTIAGFLAPEWDETNSTYYVRSAEVGAKYAFRHRRSGEIRHSVAQSDDLLIFNSETGRLLGWRQEGEDERFLVELDDAVAPPAATDFQFSTAPFSSFPLCRFVDPLITCEAYHILNFGTSLGLNPYWEDGVTYFVLSEVSNSTTWSTGFEQNSFLLIDVTSGSSSGAGAAVSRLHHHHHHHHHHLRTTAAAAEAI